MTNDKQSIKSDENTTNSLKNRSRSIEPIGCSLPSISTQTNPYLHSLGKIERRYRVPASDSELINTLIFSRDYGSLLEQKPNLFAPKQTISYLNIAVTEEERRKQRVSKYLRKDCRRVGRWQVGNGCLQYYVKLPSLLIRLKETFKVKSN